MQGLVLVSYHFLLENQQKYQEYLIILQLWGNISLLFLDKNGHDSELSHSKFVLPVIQTPMRLLIFKNLDPPVYQDPNGIWIPRIHV